MCIVVPKLGGSSASSSEKAPAVWSPVALTDIWSPPRSIGRPSPGRRTKPTVASVIVYLLAPGRGLGGRERAVSRVLCKGDQPPRPEYETTPNDTLRLSAAVP